MSQPNQAPSETERRRAKRYVIENRPIVTAMSGGKVYTCRIEEISTTGIRLRFEESVPEGKVIALEHPEAGTLCGECIWRDESNLGVEIRLPTSELERVLKCICLVL